MSYESDDESTEIRDIKEKLELLRDIQYEESESVGEENATGPVYDQQGKFRSDTDTNGGSSTPPFTDSDPLVKGSDDDSKLLRFEIDGFTTAVTRVVTVPNASFVMAGLSILSQTWTGENIFAGNTVVRDTNFFIQNTSDITKQAKFDLSGATTGKVVTLEFDHTDNRTLIFPDSSTTLAGLGVLSQTWTGTNAFVGTTTVIDSNFGIKNFSDNTKVASFDSSLISSSTTRTYSLPNSTTTLAGLGVLSQTWTGTNIFVGSVTIRDTNFFIQDGADITKQLNFELSGATTGFTLVLGSAITGNRTLTFPDTTTTLAGLGTLSQTWTGTNDFIGTTTMTDSNFGIKNFSDNTKIINFNASLISTSTTRTYSLPNSTTTLAGLGVLSQTWTGTNIYAGISTFNGTVNINNDIVLGSSSIDDITFNGETINSIIPNTTSINDVGSHTQRYSSGFFNFSVNLFGSFSGGGTPGALAAEARLFNRFNGSKYELRVLFPTGISQLIAVEP